MARRPKGSSAAGTPSRRWRPSYRLEALGGELGGHGADQADDDAPAGNAPGEFDEMLGLGPVVHLAVGAGVLPADLP
jgi:hypothetical protein